jgi:flagellar motor switch protein FliN/FliY
MPDPEPHQPPDAPPPGPVSEVRDAAGDAEAALAAASDAVGQLSAGLGASTSGVEEYVPPPLESAPPRPAPSGIELLSDVHLKVRIELGRTSMLVEDVLRLGEGTVVELDKLAGDPVDVYVNDRPIARAEILVLNDNFCVRISEIIRSAPDDEQPPPDA